MSSIYLFSKVSMKILLKNKIKNIHFLVHNNLFANNLIDNNLVAGKYNNNYYYVAGMCRFS